jgi:hypothetical protein
MVAHSIAAHFRGKGGLTAKVGHHDLHGRLVAAPTAAEKQRERQLQIHTARWEAVRAAHAQGLSWDASHAAAAETLAHTSASGSAETVRYSYKLVQRLQKGPRPPSVHVGAPEVLEPPGTLREWRLACSEIG